MSRMPQPDLDRLSSTFTGPRTDKHRDYMPKPETVTDLEPTALRMPARQEGTLEPRTSPNGPGTTPKPGSAYSAVITDLRGRRDKLSHEVDAVTAAISALEAL